MASTETLGLPGGGFPARGMGDPAGNASEEQQRWNGDQNQNWRQTGLSRDRDASLTTGNSAPRWFTVALTTALTPRMSKTQQAEALRGETGGGREARGRLVITEAGSRETVCAAKKFSLWVTVSFWPKLEIVGTVLNIAKVVLCDYSGLTRQLNSY